MNTNILFSKCELLRRKINNEVLTINMQDYHILSDNQIAPLHPILIACVNASCIGAWKERVRIKIQTAVNLKQKENGNREISLNGINLTCSA